MKTASILKKEEEKRWDDFVKSHPLSTIHQTSKWAHFQAKTDVSGKFWVVILEDEKGEISGGSVVYKRKLPMGLSWFYAGRGPLLNYENDKTEQDLAKIFNKLRDLAKKERAIFLRIDPPLLKDTKTPLFKEVNGGFQPEHTLILNLRQSLEEIRAQMKQKGRYNIKVAEKKGVKIKAFTGADAGIEDKIDTFYDIFLETTKRDKFRGHTRDYYKTMMLELGKEATLYLAYYESEAIAGIIVTKFNKQATYYFGASGNTHRNTMAPYLLQWTAIQDAKSAGCETYDFFGVSPENAKNHPWAGVTSFKKKFGGEYVEYKKASEKPFSKVFYMLYRLYKRIR